MYVSGVMSWILVSSWTFTSRIQAFMFSFKFILILKISSSKSYLKVGSDLWSEFLILLKYSQSQSMLEFKLKELNSPIKLFILFVLSCFRMTMLPIRKSSFVLIGWFLSQLVTTQMSSPQIVGTDKKITSSSRVKLFIFEYLDFIFFQFFISKPQNSEKISA